MPFHLYNHELANAPDEYFNEIDQRISRDVLPKLNWQEEPKNWKRIVIAPNCKGVKNNESPDSYLVTICKKSGLLLCDVGLWLDHCLTKQVVVHADAVRRRWHNDKENLPRFNQSRHIYFFNGTASRYIRYHEEAPSH